MKKVVIYQSGTGFTAKYAGWIAERLGCEAKEYKSVNPKELTDYDMVIYGGWIFGGIVFGYDKIKKLNLKNVIVFGVGMTVSNEVVAAKIAEQNQIPREKFYYYEGGYAPQKVVFMKKMMINMIKKSLEKKENKTAEDLHTLETFKGADNTSKEAIEDLVARCTELIQIQEENGARFTAFATDEERINWHNKIGYSLLEHSFERAKELGCTKNNGILMMNVYKC